MTRSDQDAQSSAQKIKEAARRLKAANTQFARDIAAARKRFNDGYGRLRKILDARKLEKVKASLKKFKSQ